MILFVQKKTFFLKREITIFDYFSWIIGLFFLVTCTLVCVCVTYIFSSKVLLTPILKKITGPLKPHLPQSGILNSITFHRSESKTQEVNLESGMIWMNWRNLELLDLVLNLV